MKVFFTQILGEIMLGYAGIMTIGEPAIGELDLVKSRLRVSVVSKSSKLDIVVDELQ
jgi:hypothetical protein